MSCTILCFVCACFFLLLLFRPDDGSGYFGCFFFFSFRENYERVVLIERVCTNYYKRAHRDIITNLFSGYSNVKMQNNAHVSAPFSMENQARRRKKNHTHMHTELNHWFVFSNDVCTFLHGNMNLQNSGHSMMCNRRVQVFTVQRTLFISRLNASFTQFRLSHVFKMDEQKKKKIKYTHTHRERDHITFLHTE